MDIIQKLTNKKTSREEKNIMNYSRMSMKRQQKNLKFQDLALDSTAIGSNKNIITKNYNMQVTED